MFVVAAGQISALQALRNYFSTGDAPKVERQLGFALKHYRRISRIAKQAKLGD